MSWTDDLLEVDHEKKVVTIHGINGTLQQFKHYHCSHSVREVVESFQEIVKERVKGYKPVKSHLDKTYYDQFGQVFGVLLRI